MNNRQILKDILIKYNIYWIDGNDNSIDKVKKLWNDNELYKAENDYEMHYLALYYGSIQKDYRSKKKYLQIGIKNGYSHSMMSMGSHYQFIEIDYKVSKIYYLMAAEKENPRAMNKLGYIYKYAEHDHESALKYFEMGCSYNNMECLYSLGHHFHNNKNYDLATKYFLKSAKQGYPNAITSLINIYNSHLGVYDETFYEFITCENEDIQKALPNIFKQCKKLYQSKMEPIELHFKYSLEGKGFEEAKKDFMENLMLNQ